MSRERPPAGAGEPGAGPRGSAMVLVVVLTSLLTVLGISFLVLAETEGRIGRNERLAAQALYVADAGARAVRGWFDRPGSPTNPRNPPLAVIDRSLRRIDHDGDPTTPPQPQNGSAWPRYKQGVDRNGDGRDDLFDRPYRGGLRDALLGVERGPDMRIDESASAAARSFLEDLSVALVGRFPGPAGVLVARISRIDVYRPPYTRTAGAWIPRGIGSVRVVARLYRRERGVEVVVAEREVRVVLDALRYGEPYGPLHACGDLEAPGALEVRWGAATAAGDARLPPLHTTLASSWPRAVPVAPAVDLLWGWDDAAAFTAYRSALASRAEALEDPWYRFIAGGGLAGAPPGVQPYPFAWLPGAPPGPGQWSSHEHAGEDGNHANLFQGIAPGCPAYDYTRWKAVATSGRAGTRYFAWAGGSTFREDGVGPPRTFRELTDGAEGVLFFDTVDGRAPRDVDGDGLPDNLTPRIDIGSGAWSARGLVYVNARSVRVGRVAGRALRIRAPGEPFRDANRNGVHDPGEEWVNLAYPTSLGGRFVVDPADSRQDDGRYAGAPVRNAWGPEVDASASLWGVLYVAGWFEPAGDAELIGSVIAGLGVREPLAPGGRVRIRWDASLRAGWPPPGWRLPRVRVTRWESGLR